MKAADKDLSKLGASVENLDKQIQLLLLEELQNIQSSIDKKNKKIQSDSNPKKKKALQNEPQDKLNKVAKDDGVCTIFPGFDCGFTFFLQYYFILYPLTLVTRGLTKNYFIKINLHCMIM